MRDAVIRTMDGYARRGMAWYSEEMDRRERVRGQLARLIGAQAPHLALVPNTSAGVMTVALCLPWQHGEKIVLFNGEFPTNVTPWQQAARRHGLEIVWMEAEAFRHDRASALEQLEDQLRAGVRLVAVSAVQFTTGQRMPLAEIGAMCRHHGSELFVDAIQAAGVVPLDVQSMCIDYLTAGSHKWLMAPEGLAGFYAAPQAAERLQPNVAAWLSHEEPFAFLTDGPGQLRYDRPILLSARMADPGGRSGILSVRPADPHTTSAWAGELAELGISCGTPDGWLRLSPHWPNALSEAEALFKAFDRGAPALGV